MVSQEDAPTEDSGTNNKLGFNNTRILLFLELPSSSGEITMVNIQSLVKYH